MDDVGDQDLLWVVGNIGPNAPDSTTKVTIRTANYLRCEHPWLEWLQDGSETCMEELPAEPTKSSRFSIFALSYGERYVSVTSTWLCRCGLTFRDGEKCKGKD